MRKEFIRLRFVIHHFYLEFPRCYLGMKSIKNKVTKKQWVGDWPICKCTYVGNYP